MNKEKDKKISKIEIQNFKAFYGNFEIVLDGKNLLLYGENGSGKSSFYSSLKMFLESSKENTDFSAHKNIFVDDKEVGYIKITIDDGVHTWASPDTFPKDMIIIDANKTKGFLDYKNLLETNYLHNKNDSVNLFHLLIENLLADYTESSTGRAIGEIWQSVKQKSKAKKTTNIYKIDYPKEEMLFDSVLKKVLIELKDKANELLKIFDYSIDITFTFNSKIESLLLQVNYYEKEILKHHHFFNESRLSAIALSMYFASLILQPKSNLPILALDDVLIGLDMTNRLPVIEILEKYFLNHQVFFFTHDRLWFEMMRIRTKDIDWKYAEFYCNPKNGIELPIYVENKKYLERAKIHFQANDFKATAIYTRTAFEVALKKFCEKNKLKVKYRENAKDLKSNDFWDSVKNHKKKDDNIFLEQSLIKEIELYRGIVLNPLSHSRIINITKDEVSKAIDVVSKLEEVLK